MSGWGVLNVTASIGIATEFLVIAVIVGRHLPLSRVTRLSCAGFSASSAVNRLSSLAGWEGRPVAVLLRAVQAVLVGVFLFNLVRELRGAQAL